jgi:hypothetical protein
MQKNLSIGPILTLGFICYLNNMSSIKKKTDIPEKERALVLQGGGSLGAYEAGAYMNSYQKEMKKEERREGPCSILLQALQLALLTLLCL